MNDLKSQIQSIVDIYKSGNLKEAELLSKKLIQKNPKIVFLYNLLGLISVDQEKFDQAIDYYEKGIEVDPNFAMIYNNLGLLYANNRSDYIKAEHFYRKSISLNQKISEPYNNLGTLYKSMDKFNEAIYSYEKSIEVNPKLVQAYHNLGTVYITLGKFTEAKKILTEAININPYYTNSHRTLSRLKKYTNEDDHFKKLKKIHQLMKPKDKNLSINYIKLSSSEKDRNFLKDVKVADKTNIAFALGKAYEDINDFNSSFEMYYDANKFYDQKVNYSMERDRKRFNNIKYIFHKKLYEKYRDSGFVDDSSIFILGMPRSGTTLVEQILSSHPRVFGAEEQILIDKLVQKNFVNKNLSLYFEGTLSFNKESFKKIGQEYVSITKDISNNSERITDKFPENFLWIGFIKLILPNAKIIHCERNSRDNCLSLFKNYFPSGRIDYSYDLNKIVEYYNLYLDLMKYWNILFPDFIFHIKYENLVSDTENQIRNILEFCNLDWNDNCLNFHKNKRVVKTASDIQARTKIYNTSVDSWKKYEKYLNIYFEKLNN